jgi:hypothetical protein
VLRRGPSVHVEGIRVRGQGLEFRVHVFPHGPSVYVEGIGFRV